MYIECATKHECKDKVYFCNFKFFYRKSDILLKSFKKVVTHNRASLLTIQLFHRV